MANQLNLTQLFALVEAYIRANFPQFKTVEVLDDTRESFPSPACLIEVTEGPPSAEDDPETGETACELRFQAYVAVNKKTPAARVYVAQLALDLAAALRRTRFGAPQGVKLGPARVIGNSEGTFEPALEQYRVWAVEWVQLVYLGPSVVDEGTDVHATQVLVSSAPDIGPGNEPAYEPVTG
jgi:hypothetical protein